MSNPNAAPMGVEFAIVEAEYRLWEEALKGQLPPLPYEDRREFQIQRTGVAQSQAKPEVYAVTVKLERLA